MLTTRAPAVSSNAMPSCASSPSQTMKVGVKTCRRAVHLVVLAGEDLELLVGQLALDLDPLARAEDVLGRVQEPEARAALKRQLAQERGGLGSWVTATVKWKYVVSRLPFESVDCSS